MALRCTLHKVKFNKIYSVRFYRVEREGGEKERDFLIYVVHVHYSAKAIRDSSTEV